jgi:hypothetical protein
MRSNALDKTETILIGRESERPEGVPTLATGHGCDGLRNKNTVHPYKRKLSTTYLLLLFT